MMPAMRRKDRLLSEEEALRLLEACPFGVLCTACADGAPHGIPTHHALAGRNLYIQPAAAPFGSRSSCASTPNS